MRGSVLFLIQFNWYITNVIKIFRCGGTYIYSPDWVKKKKATLNPKNIEYTATVALNYEEIKWNPESVTNVKPFINKYNWKGINYPSKNRWLKNVWEK